MRARVAVPALCAAVLALAWAALAWGVELWALGGRSLAPYLFRTQDLPALVLGGGAMLLVALWAGRPRPGLSWGWARRWPVVGTLALGFALAAWAGWHGLFHGYALSRDEQVAEFGAAALRHGGLGWVIPPEWVPFRRAIMPEFFAPFGADHVWTPAYLPLNAAVRALFGWLGDPGLASPVFLAIGLLALWRVALRLFPDRPDAVAVTLLMALSSTQLLVTGMTPYAMTGHFALNMLWLALVLRGGAVGHGLAALVLLALAGLHQYHYPLPFLLPFLLWLALGRRWGALAFHTLALALAVAVWAKAWPHLLIDLYGPAADVRPSAGVADKMDSLLGRLLAQWHPLLHLARFLAWNNLLLVPLAVLAVVRARPGALLRGETLVLPLALGAFGMAALAMNQGYGWGYRYLHGFIGSFALLAGYGWAALRAPVGTARAPLLAASVLVSGLTGGFLMMRAQAYVAPYAAAHRLILSDAADVVLVDPRGGRFVTDLVRGRAGAPLGHPVVMNLGQLDTARLDRLCAARRVALFDRSAFLPMGVGPIAWNDAYIAGLRAHLAAVGCGRVLVPPVVPSKN